MDRRPSRKPQREDTVQDPGAPAGHDAPVAPDNVHSSAPAMDRKKEPMVTQANPPPRTGRPGVHRTLDTGLPPDEDT